ncbi:MAG: exopolyphosphatase [Cytophagales bacterium]|nr:exopolyphosphatase [Cytophagales bacterium]MDW8384530.1 exopolyphosphatase [Flammeovirgaceae bacterium]
MPVAVIDLGTNTFQLLIAEKKENYLQKLFKNSLFVRIGKSGISHRCIAPDAIFRAVEAMKVHRKTIDEYGVTEIYALATSAVRNADNQKEFLDAIFEATQIRVEVIDGNTEADYIFKGVAYEIPLQQMSLIMDIGGGSVEFIIAHHKQMLWKQSFEIGGQRLLDKFFTEDPLPHAQQIVLRYYLQDALQPLWEAVHFYQPKQFIGSAGAFETILRIIKFHLDEASLSENQFSAQSFEWIFEQMTTRSRGERLSMRGMIPERVEMIVPAVCLIKTVVDNCRFSTLQVSTASLKEGVAVEKLELF